jgi:hypothetical protein
MTRSALIDMAVREAMAIPGAVVREHGWLYINEDVIRIRVRHEWPRLLSSHPIDTQGGSHE